MNRGPAMRRSSQGSPIACLACLVMPPIVQHRGRANFTHEGEEETAAQRQQRRFVEPKICSLLPGCPNRHRLSLALGARISLYIIVIIEYYLYSVGEAGGF